MENQLVWIILEKKLDALIVAVKFFLSLGQFPLRLKQDKMVYTAEVFVEDLNLYDCLISEPFDYERSSMNIRKDNDKVVIKITAKDAIAFRATTNALMQLLVVYDKTKKIE